MVQDLINQIVEKTGVPADKAQQVLGVCGSQFCEAKISDGWKPN